MGDHSPILLLVNVIILLDVGGWVLLSWHRCPSWQGPAEIQLPRLLHGLSVTGGSLGPDVVTMPGQSGPTPPSRHPTNLKHFVSNVICSAIMNRSISILLQLQKFLLFRVDFSIVPICVCFWFILCYSGQYKKISRISSAFNQKFSG